MITKKFYLIFGLILCSLFLVSGNLHADESIYGHISYVEGAPLVIRTDNVKHEGIVNLPVVPGDVIVTNDKARCELQFDNGTVMRLDKNSSIKVVSVLAKTLTSKWKMTTLQLLKGQLYVLNQGYNLERFQVLTPNAAINMKRNSVSTISLNEKGETYLFSDKGSVQVLYGNNPEALEMEKIRSGNSFTVSVDNKLLPAAKRDVDFLSWNQYIDRNFNALHEGKNKLPKKIYRYSKGIVHWAEKWSTLHGEWVYDELFGYVWKPGDKNFAYFNRPFFHAKYIWVNNQMFVVPTEKWGWVPANLGTWVWSKSGWTWVPGNAYNSCRGFALFKNAAEYDVPYYWNTLYPYLYYAYSYNEGYLSHSHWLPKKRVPDYMDQFKKAPLKKPDLEKAPENIRAILKKLENAPEKLIAKHLNGIPANQKKELLKKASKEFATQFHRRFDLIRTEQTKRENKDSEKIVKNRIKARPTAKNAEVTKKTAVAANTQPKTTVKTATKSKSSIHTAKRTNNKAAAANIALRYYRDWNPDKRWAQKRGVAVFYSSKTNEVVCPGLKLRSSTITPSKRLALKRSNRSNVRKVTNSTKSQRKSDAAKRATATTANSYSGKSQVSSKRTVSSSDTKKK